MGRIGMGTSCSLPRRAKDMDNLADARLTCGAGASCSKATTEDRCRKGFTADEVGFESTVRFAHTTVSKAAALNRSATPLCA